MPPKQASPAEKNGPVQECAHGQPLSEGNLHLAFRISKPGADDADSRMSVGEINQFLQSSGRHEGVIV